MAGHTISPVKLVLGALVLLLAGAAAFWAMSGRLLESRVAIVRDGSLEIELWAGTLSPSGADLVWDYQPNHVELSLYTPAGSEDDAEVELGQPVPIAGTQTIHIDLRLGSVSIVSDAVVLSMNDGPLRISVKDGQLTRRGDLWVHPGFVVGGEKKRIRIAKIEFRDANNQVISRYQSPSQGKLIRFRVKLVQR